MRSRQNKTDPVTCADARVHRLVAPHNGSPAVRLLSKLSDIGDQPQLRLLSGALIAGGLLRSNRRLLRTGLRMILVHELTTLAKNVVKESVDRTRPRSADGQRDMRMRKGRSRAKEESSFPSGHSAGAIAVARAFAREFPEHAQPALGAAAAVAAAQVPRCAHYASDVGAGLLIGAAVEEAVHWAWSRLFDDPSVPAAEQRQPDRAQAVGAANEL